MSKPRIFDFFIKDDGVWEAIGEFAFSVDPKTRKDPLDAGKVTDFYYWVEDQGKDLYCRVKGHEFQPDQCGIPEHDYCVWCLVPRPEGVPRPT